MDRTLWRPQPNVNQPPPTHVLGLLDLPDEELSLLIWGPCELVEVMKVSVQLTFYDSAARLRTGELMQKYMATVLDHLRSSIPEGYDIVVKSVLRIPWTDYLLDMSEPEINMVFCQMISAVVHELPFRETLNKSPLVDPIWATSLIEAQVRSLLGQIVDGKLHLKDLMTGEGFVPECIYLHGDPFETDAPGVEDILGDMDIPEENDPQGDLMTRVDAWVNQRAALESMAETNWYVRASNGISYQTGTPSDFSKASTPAIRSFSSPSRDPSETDDADQKSLIESTHMLLLNSREFQHPARVAFWQQLRESITGMECITLITVHLWLSSLLADPARNVFYIDPELAMELVKRYDENPLEMDENFPELFDREKLWLRMGSTVNILVLFHLQGLVEPDPGELSWILLDMKAERGRVTTMDVVLPPCTTYDKDRFAYLASLLIGGLNSILPRRTLVTHSSKVQQRTHSLILPQPFTQESVVLVMLGYLLGKMLGQEVQSVDVNAMRQGICFYYNHALCVREADLSFPWHGLTDLDGQLLTQENAEEVRQRRFILSNNREPSPFEMFPRRRSYTATMATPGPSEPFFLELAQSCSDHPAGILVGTTGRSVTALEKAMLLGPYPSFPENDDFPDTSLQGPRSLSIDQFVALIHSLGGPESKDAHIVLLTGKHRGRRITIDWLKDATYPLAEWLMAGFDLDSLSLTSYEAPEFLEAGSYNPFPNRAMSLTNRNELTVIIDGKKIEMHTCPNFCIMTFGANNQFRLLVFLPGCRNRVQLLWRNIPRKTEMEDWYHVFLTALRLVAAQVPYHWRHAAEKTIEALPTTYQMAADQTNHGGGERSFVGHRIEPVILNHVFKVMRHIINSTPRFAKYRGYFFHLCGINLKLATMNIHGREDANPLNYAFTIYRFINWYIQNPHDIIADVGLAVNAHRASMPEDLQRSTMLFRYGPLRELLRLGYRKPHQDRYCLSYTVSGARAVALAEIQSLAGVLKFQAYMKEMVLLYRHRDKSVGANFTVEEALGLGHREKFPAQIKAFQDILAVADTYGLRTEVRLTAWGANRYMQMDPRDVLDRLISANAMLCYPTRSLTNFKIMLSKGWSSIISRQSQLPVITRRTPEVMLLTSVLAYWLKSLVKRPDEMSPTREMVVRLYLTETAEQHGLPFLRTPALDEDGLRVSYLVEAESFKIIQHSKVIIPGGNRIKGSKAIPAIAQPPDPLLSPPPSPPRVQEPLTLWPQSSEDFLQSLVNVHLPQALWTMFPKERLRSDVNPQSLKKPLKLASWSNIVDHMNTTRDVRSKFIYALNMLFPDNWETGETEGQLFRYDQAFLYRIQNHVKTKPIEDQSAYSEELRNRIRALVMQKYDYLPCVQSHKIWPFDSKAGGHRQFRIARK
ncbi:hypothetical protein FRC11_001382 [Ceratobasidium sp. 423]|nr:hypothetical protein FRC11_001382 [Ceratobasidium sp. 423]